MDEAEYYKLPALHEAIQSILSRPPPPLQFTPDPLNHHSLDESCTIARPLNSLAIIGVRLFMGRLCPWMTQTL